MTEVMPCPACGSTDILTISGHISSFLWWVRCCGCGRQGSCCKTEEDAISAWNTLPRALTWTHEPPKVAGWYWMRRKVHGKWRNRGIVHIYMDFAGTKTLQAKGWGRQVGGLENMGIDFEWAGPIAPPID